MLANLPVKSKYVNLKIYFVMSILIGDIPTLNGNLNFLQHKNYFMPF